MEKVLKTQKTEEKRKTRFDRKKLLSIGIATLFVAAAVAVIILFYPRKTVPIDHFYKALQTGSVTELQKCMPPDAWSYASGKYSADEQHRDSFRDHMNDYVSGIHGMLLERYGQKLKISYRVTNKEEFGNEELNQLAQELYRLYEIDPLTITEACTITVDTTCKGKLCTETSQADTFVVYKLNGKWYLFFDPFYSITK